MPADPRVVWLIIDLLDALLARFTDEGEGHLMQQVSQEHRGNCLPPKDGCTVPCLAAQALRDAALDWLEQQAAEQPRQLELMEAAR